MRQYCLYLACKQILSALSCPATTPTYNSMSAVEDNAIGVYVRGGLLPRGRNLATGAYIRKADRVQFLMQSGKDKTSILNWECFNEKLENEMPTYFNRVFDLDATKIGFDSQGHFTTDTKDIVKGVRLLFIRTDPQSGVMNIGRSAQGLTRYSCNYVIEYSIGEYTLTSN